MPLDGSLPRGRLGCGRFGCRRPGPAVAALALLAALAASLGALLGSCRSLPSVSESTAPPIDFAEIWHFSELYRSVRYDPAERIHADWDGKYERLEVVDASNGVNAVSGVCLRTTSSSTPISSTPASMSSRRTRRESCTRHCLPASSCSESTASSQGW